MIINTQGLFVDFDKPIRMSPRQINEFKVFILSEFGSCEEKKVTEKVPEREGGTSTQKKWKESELVELFSGKSIGTLERELDRNSMSIEMKTQSFVFGMVAWAKKKGKAIPPTIEDIREYLGEKE